MIDYWLSLLNALLMSSVALLRRCSASSFAARDRFTIRLASVGMALRPSMDNLEVALVVVLVVVDAAAVVIVIKEEVMVLLFALDAIPESKVRSVVVSLLVIVIVVVVVRFKTNNLLSLPSASST